MNGIHKSLNVVFVCGLSLCPAIAQESPAPPAIPRYSVKALPAPRGFDFFQPRRINNRGEILGHADASRGVFADHPHAAFYRRGKTIDLHLLAPGRRINRNSLPVDLNDNGQLLFRLYGGSPEDRYFLYQEGRLRDFDRLVGRTDLEPFGLNAAGQIVGMAGADENNAEAFLYADEQVTLLGKLEPFPQSYAVRISNSGHIAGTVRDEVTDEARAVVFASTGIVDIGLAQSYALDVNDSGHVLGTDQFEQASFLWLGPGQFVSLPFVPAGMNDHDQVVGYFYPPWPPRAAVFSEGVAFELNGLVDSKSQWELLYAFDINNRGQIAGVGKRNGQWSGFVLDPIKN